MAKRIAGQGRGRAGEGVRFLHDRAAAGRLLVSANSVISQGGGTVTFIQFSGHGYKATIDALSKFTNSGASVAGLGTKNVTTVTLMPVMPK